MLKVTQCVGEGQGQCKRCAELKGWNCHWMSFLYRIEGRDGIYCHECVNAIIEEEENNGTSKEM